MIAVAAVLTGDKYPAWWVDRLFAAVARHLPIPHATLIVTDHAIPPKADIRIRTSEPGWWAKLELFRLDRTLLYFDLDCVITGDLRPLVEAPGPLIAIHDWQHRGMINSSVMRIESETSREVWDRYQDDKAAARASCNVGDQEWITRHAPAITYWPAQWCVSYKRHCQSGVPDGARAVAFHGKPKQDAVRAPWVAEHWY